MEHVGERRDLGPFSVAPIGFGAMRLTGPNVFGPPRDRREAIRVLHEAVERGVNHIDTAQFYGPDIVNELIREALHPYPRELILVSKVGARRDRSGAVLADDEPHQLRRAIEATSERSTSRRCRLSTCGSCATPNRMRSSTNSSAP